MNQTAKTFLVHLLRGYKWAISPMFSPACRYLPTCSEYAMEAVDRYGIWRGSLMALWRVLRCHPFAKGGYDPVGQPKDSSAAAGEVTPAGLCGD
ncbi:MAG: membrane protein insertion efficiency factor YidD [Acidobacteria bacterium 13_1_40CM_4_58_4]|jgi:putative membrane protein insertion efficiency factor|nr:MAG: membrane protein insertion efficiency factor YidD [Acidobacteria bacterium 13_1_40CM_4_58_4]HLB88919.1 membrane protein insertion efficiency factor YidD [Terriglobales bacterium]